MSKSADNILAAIRETSARATQGEWTLRQHSLCAGPDEDILESRHLDRPEQSALHRALRRSARKVPIMPGPDDPARCTWPRCDCETAGVDEGACPRAMRAAVEKTTAAIAGAGGIADAIAADHATLSERAAEHFCNAAPRGAGATLASILGRFGACSSKEGIAEIVAELTARERETARRCAEVVESDGPAYGIPLGGNIRKAFGLPPIDAKRATAIKKEIGL